MLKEKQIRRLITGDVSELANLVDNEISFCMGDEILYYKKDGVVKPYPQDLGDIDVITTVQPTPTATGNTTNLNSTFKDANGDIWIVDKNGDAIQVYTATTSYSKMLFVDAVNGDDTTGDGSDNRMFQTIGKALSVASSGYRIVLGAGTYNENVTVSLQNVDITTVAGTNRGNTFINGSVTFTNSASSSGIDGISFNTLVVSGSGNVYVKNCIINTSVTKSGSGYFEVLDSEVTGVTITGSNQSVFIAGKQYGLTVSGASSIVSVKDSNNLSVVTVTSGTLAVDNSIGFAATSNGKAITSSVGTTVILANSQFYGSTGLLTGLTLSGNYSTDDIQFDKVNSTLGTNLSAIGWSDKIGLINPTTIATATKVLVRDSNGVVNEQLISTFAGDKYSTTSTTCHDISTASGDITLTVEPGLSYVPLQTIALIDATDSANHMHCDIVSYNKTTGELVVNVKQKSGTGNICNWLVNLDSFNVTSTSVVVSQNNTSGHLVGSVTVNGSTTELFEKVTTVTSTLSSGTLTEKIGTYTNESGTAVDIYASKPFDVLTSNQPTPTATGNTSNLNSIFKDANGDSWAVDGNGDAVKLGSPFTNWSSGTNTPTSTGNTTTSLGVTSLPIFYENTTTGIKYYVDANGVSKVIEGASTITTTTSLAPKTGNGTAYVNPTLVSETTLVDEIQLSDGSYIRSGQVTFTGHGLPIHTYFYASATAPYYTATVPTTGWSQQLFYTQDANTIDVLIQEGVNLDIINNGGSGQDFAKIVYVNATSPSTATIFDTNNPPVTNDPALQNNSTYLYVGTSGQTYTYNGTSYVTYTAPASSNFYFNGTTTDAGSDKTNVISRPQDIVINGVRIGRSSGNVQTNTVIGGGGALGANTTGDNNVALGEYALGSNTTGGSNFGMGFASLSANITGSFNVGLGRASLRWSTGNYNIGIGMQALSASGMNSSNNVGIGWLAGAQTTTGGSNIAIGTGSGGHTTGSRNITIGTDAKVVTATASGQVNIGNSLFATGATSTSSSTPLGNWGVGNSNPLEKVHIEGAIKIGNGGYTTVTNGATTPIPAGGAGTIIFVGTNFFGFDGTAWRQLNN